MDELSRVRQLLDEPPPTPDVMARGRAEMLAPRRTAATPAFQRTAFTGLAMLGLAGAAALAVLATGALQPGTAPTGGGGHPAATYHSARSLLLAAAKSAESTAADGEYWHVRTVSTTTWPDKVGAPGNRYTLQLRTVTETWAGADGQAWRGIREWAKPQSADDEAAWRRDGSPSSWCMGQTDTEPAQADCLTAAPGTASLAKEYRAFEVAEGRDLSYEQLQRLPTDPRGLRTWVTNAVTDDLDPSASGDIIDLNVTTILANLLVDVPVPPAVRAAAYEALAAMPNVESTGPTHDRLGRAGYGIRISFDGKVLVGVPGTRTGSVGAAQELIIDPDTSYVLATEIDPVNGSEPVMSTVIPEVGWTDERPHEPNTS